MEKVPIGRGQVFAHIPYRLLRASPETVIRRHIQPEIYFSTADLDAFDEAEGERLAGALAAAGLGCTFHGPFHDLNPGSLDEEIRALTLRRYRRVLEIGRAFSPRTVVFHPGYDHWRYDGRADLWLERSRATFSELLEDLERTLPATVLAVENIYETGPESLADLLDGLASPRAGFCFDSGHFLLFSRSTVDDWMDALAVRLVEVHLHDNDGRRDSHRPPGEGVFPFPDLWRRIGRKVSGGGVCLTLEAHSVEDLDRSLAWLGATTEVVDKPPDSSQCIT